MAKKSEIDSIISSVYLSEENFNFYRSSFLGLCGMGNNSALVELLSEILCEKVRILSYKTMPYHQYLKTNHWQTIKNRALKLAGSKCQICGKKRSNHITLDVHHNNYESVGQEKPDDVVVLCRNHHRLVEKEKLERQLSSLM